MKKQNNNYGKTRFDYKDVKNKIDALGYTLISKKYKNCDSRLIIKDDEGYFFRSTLYNLSYGKKPHIVSKYNIFSIRNINTYIKNKNISCVMLSTEYTGTNNALLFRCKCGNNFERTWNDFSSIDKNMCIKCSRKRVGKANRTNTSVVFEMFERHGYTLLTDAYVEAHALIRCENKDGYRGCLSYNNLLNGYHLYPFKASNSFFIYNVQRFIDLNNLKCNLLTRSIGKRNTLNGLELSFKCECGIKYKTEWRSFAYQQVYRCKECSKKKSKYEIATSEFLDGKSIHYREEYSFFDCRDILPLRFDFVIHHGDKTLAIEVDGQFHYQNIYGQDLLDSQKRRDKIKNKYCLKNDIILLRIPYWEYNDDSYKEIIQKGLDKLQS